MKKTCRWHVFSEEACGGAPHRGESARGRMAMPFGHPSGRAMKGRQNRCRPIFFRFHAGFLSPNFQVRCTVDVQTLKSDIFPSAEPSVRFFGQKAPLFCVLRTIHRCGTGRISQRFTRAPPHHSRLWLRRRIAPKFFVILPQNARQSGKDCLRFLVVSQKIFWPAPPPGMVRCCPR